MRVTWLAVMLLAVGLTAIALPAARGEQAASGRQLYVNGATGNDATPYAQNSAERPWRTIGRATWGSSDRERRNGAEAARAGDTVLVAAGTYDGVGTNRRNEIVYYTENSGEPGRPIVFRAQGEVRLTLSSGKGPLIGAYRRNHITWDGFTISEATAPSVPDTGSVTVWECDGCVLEHLDIDGNGSDNNRPDNHTGVRIEASKNVTVRNNRIHNVYTGSNANNGACIQVYASGALLFEHNELFQCGSGIFLKGGPPINIDYLTVRYNLIRDIGENRGGGPAGSGIIMHAGAATRPEAPTRVYQNIVINAAEAGIKIWVLDGERVDNNPMNARIYNNTIRGGYYGLLVQGPLLADSGHVFHNNIIAGTTVGLAADAPQSTAQKSRFDAEHNLYFRTSTLVDAGGSSDLNGWRKRSGQDGAEPASKTGDPKFVDEKAGDFRLRAESAAIDLGVDALDLNGNGSTTDRIPAGAYVTGTEVIGRQPRR